MPNYSRRILYGTTGLSTTHDTYGMKEAALKAGCDGYLTKPIDFERLEKIVGRILASH